MQIRWQWVLVIIMAVALAISGVMAISSDDSNVGAQSDQLTWKVHDLRQKDPGLITGSSTVNPSEFVEQVPIECDIVPDPHSEFRFYYRCPMIWEPA